MTFGNMRANGVRDLRVYCATNFCHHQAIINVTASPMICSSSISTGVLSAPLAARKVT
jgi:hypothetical protein